VTTGDLLIEKRNEKRPVIVRLGKASGLGIDSRLGSIDVNKLA
jgi:hypothetical protein